MSARRWRCEANDIPVSKDTGLNFWASVELVADRNALRVSNSELRVANADFEQRIARWRWFALFLGAALAGGVVTWLRMN